MLKITIAKMVAVYWQPTIFCIINKKTAAFNISAGFSCIVRHHSSFILTLPMPKGRGLLLLSPKSGEISKSVV